MNAFEILGIEPTEDKKTIKKAYASLVKKYHPEEDMQKWQEIHEAYQSALKWAEGRNYLTKTAAVLVHPSEESAEKTLWQQDTRSVKESDILQNRQEAPKDADHVKKQEETELNELFDNLEELSIALKTEKNEQEKRELEKAIAELEQIGRMPKLKYESFKELFFQEGYQQAIRKNDFLYSWSKLLERRTINKKLYQLMKEQLESIIQYRVSNDEVEETAGLIEPTRLTRMRIDGAYDRYKVNRKRLSKVAIFGTLILLEVVPFVFYKINGQTNQRVRWAQETQVSQEMQEAIKKQLRDELERQMFYSEISLETLTEADLHLAKESWNELAKFLMRADDEILSMVLPYTQFLEHGVLVLSEEFDIGQALQGEKDKEETKNIENSYELVLLSLPFDNQIRVGKETIDLSKEAIRFAIRTEGEAGSVQLWVNPEEMGFEEGCEIYYFDGEEYRRVGGIWNDDGMPTERHYYDVLTYRVFWVQVSRLGENEFPVILAPIK